MQGVLSGFAVIAVVIGVGYAIGRRGHLGDQGRDVLTRLAFHVASPALLFTTIARADLSVIFSNRLLVTALSTAAAAGVFVAVGAVRRWGVGRTTIGALCSSYVNSGNLGIPIAVYVRHRSQHAERDRCGSTDPGHSKGTNPRSGDTFQHHRRRRELRPRGGDVV